MGTLIVCAPLVPLIDAWLPGQPYDWPVASSHDASPLIPVPHPCPFHNQGGFRETLAGSRSDIRCGAVLLRHRGVGLLWFLCRQGRQHTFNKASEVAIARHDNKTVITMANDYEGDAKEFALVVPVPTILEKGQIHVGDPALPNIWPTIRLRDSWNTSTRIPCRRYDLMERRSMDAMKAWRRRRPIEGT